METKTYRVWNRTTHDIGVKTWDGRSYNIRPGTLVPLSEEDIIVINNGCGEFRNGHLEIENIGELAQKIGFEPTRAQGLITEEEIKKKLSVNGAPFAKWLSGLNDPETLYRVFKVAEKLPDLSASKIKQLEAKTGQKMELGE